MKLITVIFFLILSLNLFSQDFPELSKVIQISNVDGDAKNASFISSHDYYYSNPLVFFEVHKVSNSNIYSLAYDQNQDEFNNLKEITNDSCLNLNPVCLNNFLFFQTNKNGNWDIAYKIFTDSIWSETRFVTNSLDNEIQPVSFINAPFDYRDSIKIMYLKNNSVYISAYRDSMFVSELIFQGSDSIYYEQPTAIENYWGYYMAYRRLYSCKKNKFNK